MIRMKVTYITKTKISIKKMKKRNCTKFGINRICSLIADIVLEI